MCIFTAEKRSVGVYFVLHADPVTLADHKKIGDHAVNIVCDLGSRNIRFNIHSGTSIRGVAVFLSEHVRRDRLSWSLRGCGDLR